MEGKIRITSLIVSALSFFASSAFFGGCAIREPSIDYNKEELSSYSFNVNSKSVLKNPPKDKSRIYFVRENAFVGGGVYYSYYIHFASLKKSTLAGYLKNGWAFYVDVAPDMEISITNKQHTIGWVIALSAFSTVPVFDGIDTGLSTTFVPESGKIYCLNKEMLLIDRLECERVWATYIKDEDIKETQEKQIQYLGEYLIDENNSLLSKKIILRSFDKRKSQPQSQPAKKSKTSSNTSKEKK